MIELMAETVDMLRDVCMDPRVPNGIKESLWSHAGKLNAVGKSDLHDYVTQRVAAEREAKDGAYLERNRCVALIARMAVAMDLPVAVTKTAIEGWSEDWHGCIYIGLPTGQVSWHFHVSQAHLFDGLPRRAEAWDGHDTPEKYRRVDAAYRVDDWESDERDDLYWRLHSLSKALESSGRVDADDYPDAYATVLDAMNTMRSKTRSQKLADAGFTRRPGLWAMQAREVLELIAAPMRPDGTWNRDREACRELAAGTLGCYDDSETHNAKITGLRREE